MTKREMAHAVKRSRKLSNEMSNGGVSQRLSHPGRYNVFMAISVGQFLLALNFLIMTPAFNPLGIPKLPTGIVFLAVGSVKLVYLNLTRPLKYVRTAVAVSMGMMAIWAGLQFLAVRLDRQTSYQSPILYMIIAVVEFFVLIEPFTNLTTQKIPNGNGNGH